MVVPSAKLRAGEATAAAEEAGEEGAGAGAQGDDVADPEGSNTPPSVPGDFSLEMREAELGPHTGEEGWVPVSLPPPPPGLAWQWFAVMRTAVLRPQGWSAWHGAGVAFGMPYQRAVLTPDGVVPSAEAPAPVSLTVTVYAGAYSQRVLKATTGEGGKLPMRGPV
jgi:hypothetical protein